MPRAIASGGLDRLVVRYRRLRAGIGRPIGRHPWIVAAMLFFLVAVATALPWHRGIPDLGVRPWHDSESTLLQARMILDGHLVRPGLEHPDFFRTLHVLVTPIYCSKYPPGYAVLMVVGLLAKCVEWVPPMLVGLAAGAVWLLGRRIVGRWPGLLAACVFATCPMVIRLGTIQLSSTLSLLLGVLILGIWAGQIRRRPTHRQALLIGLMLSWMLLTRPFDAVALGVLVVAAQLALGGLGSRGNWRWLATLCLAGLPGVAGLLAYHQITTGDWRQGPYMLYERQQGCGGQFLHEPLTLPPHLESLPVNVREHVEAFTAPAHRRHTFARLPVTIAIRFAALSRDLGFAMLLLPLLALPMTWSCRAARPLPWVCAGFFAAYLLYAFDFPRYLAPVVAGLIWSTLAGLRGIAARGDGITLRGRAADFGPRGLSTVRARRPSATGPRLTRPSHLLELLVVALIAVGAFSAVHRLAILDLDPPTRQFHDLLTTLPPGPKLVFVRYAPDHSYHREYVFNEPDLERAECVFAHDLGVERNAELIAAYPHRQVFLYDEAGREMIPLTR